MSSPQALAQCENTIRTIGAESEEVYDTAGAALLISEGTYDRSYAAIASEVAAAEYGLEILSNNCQDVKNNFTRFILISKYALPIHPFFPKALESPKCTAGGSSAPSEASKVVLKSTMFAAMPHKHLFRALGFFHLRSVPVLRVESRPLPTALRNKLLGTRSVWEVDNMVSITIEAYVDSDSDVFLNIVRDLKEFAGHVCCFGTYVAYPEGSTRRQLLDDPNVFITRSAIQALSDAHTNKEEHSELKERDLELKTSALLSDSHKNAVSASATFRIGIMGFGTFGQFLARRFVHCGFEVVGCSRSDHSKTAKALGCEYVSNLKELLGVEGVSKKVDVIVMATSIVSFEAVLTSQLKSILVAVGNCQKSLDALFNDVVVVDVLSVKNWPKKLLSNLLPSTANILCTHPMFGPESGRDSWKNLPFMFEVVRASPVGTRAYTITEAFLGLFRREGCKMIQMSCEEHDRIAAGTQFLTHLTGRILGEQQIQPSSIDTKGYKSLLEVVRNSCADSFDLFQGLYRFNPNSEAQLDLFQAAFFKIRAALVRGNQDALLEQMSVLEKKYSKENDDQHQIIKESLSNQLKNAQLSALAKSTKPSATVAIHAKTMELKAQGKKIFGLSVGEPDFKPPAVAINAMTKALEDGETKYTEVAGTLRLRSAICKYIQKNYNLNEFKPSDVVVSNGAKQAVYQTVLALTDPGDEVVIPSPCWVSYPDIVELTRAIPVTVKTNSSDGFKLTASLLRTALKSSTRLLILCNPSNPSGNVSTREDMDGIADLLKEPQFEHITVIEDLIYDQLTYFDSSTVGSSSIHTLSSRLPGRVVFINGFSKSMGMPGLRLGYAVAPPHIARSLCALQGQLTSCASSIAQVGAAAALEWDGFDGWLSKNREVLKKKRDMCVQGLRDAGLGVDVMPDGAFYVLPSVQKWIGAKRKNGVVIRNSIDFVSGLLEDQNVALVPGEAFHAPGFLRVSYATDIEIVMGAVNGVKQFTESLTIV